ncbi:MAG: DUF2029 domain-containing protein [Clostridiales bacterium]|nr:DUF2029 domain-containing protein [Clostridiales bacterium]
MPAGKLVVTKNKVFVFTFFLLYAISFLLLFSRRGLGLYFHPDFKDSFMDLFNMAASPFNSTYPPFSLIGFKILHLLTHPDIACSSFALKQNYYGAWFVMLYIFAFSSMFLYIIFFSIRGDNKRKIFYSILFLFSGIVLWATERANVMSFAFLFSLLFAIFYVDGDERKKRLSYVFIALAISLKLYPGAFLLLLLEKKDFKGFFLVILETIAIFVFSYAICQYLDFLIQFEYDLGLMEYMKDIRSYIKVLFHLAAIFFVFVFSCFVIYEIYRENWRVVKILGFFSFAAIVFFVAFISLAKKENIISFVLNVFKPIMNAIAFGNERAPAVESVSVSAKNLFLLINFLLTGNSTFSKSGMVVVFKVLCVFLCVFSFVFNERSWKKLASASLLCMYVPDFSGFYLLIYFIIPLLFFINEKENNKIDYVYACLFAIITTFFIIPFKLEGGIYYNIITGSFIVISLCVFLFLMLLFFDAICNVARKGKELK